MNIPEGVDFSELHKRRIDSLYEAGFFTFLAYSNEKHYALVLPTAEYIRMRDGSESDEIRFPGQFIDTTELLADPRFKSSDSLWQALVDAQEATMRQIDGESDETYYALDDVPDNNRLGEIAAIAIQTMQQPFND